MTDTYHPRYTSPGPVHQVFAVDLGKHKLGVATAIVRHGEVRVLDARTLQHPKKGQASPSEVASMVHVWAAGQGLPAIPQVWVCEWPQKYRSRRHTHENLEDLYAVGSAIRNGLPHSQWDERWKPHEWKGNVPKAPHRKRLEAELTRVERKTILYRPLGHDAWDAVGILLFATGRTKRGGVK